MNHAHKMIIEEQLRTNLTNWMLNHGSILIDRKRSNQYVNIRIIKIAWMSYHWTIIQVNDVTCKIEKSS